MKINNNYTASRESVLISTTSKGGGEGEKERERERERERESKEWRSKKK